MGPLRDSLDSGGFVLRAPSWVLVCSWNLLASRFGVILLLMMEILHDLICPKP